MDQPGLEALGVVGARVQWGGEGLQDDGMTWVRCVTLMLSTIFWLPQSSAAPVLPAQVAVYFSLHGGAMEAVVRELAVAKLQGLMQAYTFTSASIA